MNHALGNIGKTVVYTDPIEAESNNQTQSLRELAGDMDAGRVTMLVIVSANPVYTAPADLKFAERLQKVGLRIHLSLYEDETSALCQWHIPEAHYLESWSDARAYDGTVTILQPLIAPLYRGKTAHELLAALTDRPERSSYDIVRDYWRTHWPSAVKEEAGVKARAPGVRDQKPVGKEASRGSVQTSRDAGRFRAILAESATRWLHIEYQTPFEVRSAQTGLAHVSNAGSPDPRLRNRAGHRLPPGLHRIRWAVFQQWLASGASQAA